MFKNTKLCHVYNMLLGVLFGSIESNSSSFSFLVRIFWAVLNTENNKN